jgi:hypothetical protein
LQNASPKTKTRAQRPASSELICKNKFAKSKEFAKTKEAGSARPARTGARTATAASTTAFGARTGAKHWLRLHRQETFALQLLAGEFARAAHRVSIKGHDGKWPVSTVKLAQS